MFSGKTIIFTGAASGIGVQGLHSVIVGSDKSDTVELKVKS